MKHWKHLTLTAVLLAATQIVLAERALSQPTPPSSVKSSPASATRVRSEPLAVSSEQPAVETTRKGVGKSDVNAACMAAAVELEKTRILTAALETENAGLNERLAVERRATSLLTELAETRSRESAALRSAVDAKNEALAAKDQVIASQADALKAKRPSPWRRVGDILIGVAAAAILK